MPLVDIKMEDKKMWQIASFFADDCKGSLSHPNGRKGRAAEKTMRIKFSSVDLGAAKGSFSITTSKSVSLPRFLLCISNDEYILGA